MNYSLIIHGPTMICLIRTRVIDGQTKQMWTSVVGDLDMFSDKARVTMQEVSWCVPLY
jgi:hypothetical protein